MFFDFVRYGGERLRGNKNYTSEYNKTKGVVAAMLPKRRCCRSRPKGAGLFFIAIGTGLFLAYVIPRYLLITILGICFISTGACMLIKK